MTGSVDTAEAPRACWLASRDSYEGDSDTNQFESQPPAATLVPDGAVA